MKIAYFSDTFYPQINGVVTSMLNSLRILAEKGHKIIIFTTKTPKKGNLPFHKNISVVRYASVNAFKYPGYELVIPKALHCLKMISKFKPSIIHIHTPTILGWIGVLAGRIRKIPVVGTYHTIVPDFLRHSPIPKIGELKAAKLIAWRYTNSFYEKCDVVTTPSKSMKKELIKNGLKKRIEVVSNGVDLHLFRKRKRKRKKFRILYVGRVSYEKNIDIVLKAVSIFSKRCQDFEFLVVGSGPDNKKLELLGKELGIGRYTNFIGAVNNRKLPYIYSSSDIFVTASTIETEGIVLLEAMACGLPVIGVDARAVPEIVKDNFNGITVMRGDYKAMSKAILKLHDDAKLRKKMGSNAIKMVRRYDVRICMSKMEAIYKRLISAGHGIF